MAVTRTISETVSVVVPCYNGEEYLRETLESALDQTVPPLEILVVDDGSTDASASIAEAFGDPVRVIRQPNQGESVARNRGIDEARGDWVAFLDADDQWLATKLERQLELVTDTTVFVCTSHFPVRADNWNAKCFEVDRFRPVTIRPENFELTTIMREGAPCLVQSVMVRRSMPTRFPTWTSYGEDTLYLLELSARNQFAVVSEPLVLYRLGHGGQASRVDMDCRWHESMAEWLDRNPQRLTENTLEDCRNENDRRLFNSAVNARRRLDETRFHTIRSYCASLPSFAFHTELQRIAKRPRTYYLCARLYHRFCSPSR